ncbi:MAG: hypothetical protein HZB46_08255, partial [Solirubrobacterales bacterium]|nr:hypothetical protein [Solirubrobacterales bacterium]
PPKPLWALSIDRDPGTGRDCVAPGPGAVGDGRYPVALPVRLVLRKRDLATPGVADAAGRLVTTPPDRLAAAGLAPPTRAARAKALQRLER